MKPIYLDYNATTPVDQEVLEEMLPYFTEKFGNPSSNHYYGKIASDAIKKARFQLAELINCQPDEIIFTSGGTEANNHAITGILPILRKKGNHIITSCIEHPSVLEVFESIKHLGFEITLLDVDEYGRISIKDLEKQIRPTTILISVMHANNELGTIQPVEEIGQIAESKGIIFHTDAAQTIGKIDTDVNKIKPHLLSIAGHKFYAPKGVGALYIKRGTHLHKFLEGAGQEYNNRAGTENVAGIVGLGKAAEIAKRDFSSNITKMLNLRELLYNLMSNSIPGIKLNGHPELRLPNTLNISFPGINSNEVINQLDDLALSAGSACHSGSKSISVVLPAIRLPENLAHGTIRFSTGKYLTENEVITAAEKIIQIIKTKSSNR
ncbi:MAG: cysteine desulfurase family protein [Bacteroidales bacterium]